METTLDTKQPVKQIEIEKKREIISVQVSAEEKRKITTMALKDHGISISEFVRTKIFIDPKPEVIVSESPLLDEERESYEKTIDSLNDQIKDIRSKLSLVTDNKALVTSDENQLIIPMEPGFSEIINSIRTFRENKKLSLDNDDLASFLNDDQYFKLIFIRGFKRSFNNGVLKSNTGITLDEIQKMAEIAGLDYDIV